MISALRRPARGLAVLALIAASAGATAAAPAVAARHSAPKTQELAVVLTQHRVVSSLGPSPSRVGSIGSTRPITGGQTVLPVVGHRTTDAGVDWLRVMLPGRPNSSKGWIEQQGTELTETDWRIVVSLSSRRVHVFRDGRRVRTFTAIVGKPSTPTPRGSFFVEESIRMNPGAAGGPFALALSARSNVLQEFDGGPGQIALHGLENLGGKLGTAASHGCVRLANRNITWLVAHIAPGVPVVIRG